MSLGDSQPVITLDYAKPLTPDERIPQAEAVLLAGGSLAQYRKHFDTTRHAVAFYGRFQAHRFSREFLDHICVNCGVLTEKVLRIRWQLTMSPRTLEFAISDASYTVTFFTHHSCCAECRDSIRRRYRFHRNAKWIIVALSIAVLLIALQDPPWLKPLRDRLGDNAAPLVICLFIAGVIVAAIFEATAQRCLPAGIRKLGRLIKLRPDVDAPC